MVGLIGRFWIGVWGFDGNDNELAVWWCMCVFVFLHLRYLLRALSTSLCILLTQLSNIASLVVSVLAWRVREQMDDVSVL